jgi:hypothetical protein
MGDTARVRLDRAGLAVCHAGNHAAPAFATIPFLGMRRRLNALSSAESTECRRRAHDVPARRQSGSMRPKVLVRASREGRYRL